MNKTRGSIRSSRLIKMSAAVGTTLIIAGLAAAKPVTAYDYAIDQAPVVTATATADEPTLREGSRNATPSEFAVKELPRGPEIAVDGLFGPKADTVIQVVPR